jgi:triacylglycerol lipase
MFLCCTHGAAALAAPAAARAGELTFELSLPTSRCGDRSRQLQVAAVAAPLDPRRLVLLLWASAIAYLPAPTLRERVLAAGFDEVRFIDRSQAGQGASDLQAFVAARPGLRLLAIRGSQEPGDWLTNSIDTTTPGAPLGLPGWLHAGYALVLSSAWSELREALLTLGDARDPLLVTGHSMGGALAVIVALRLAAEEVPLAGVITFAAPRAGDREFARAATAALGDRLVRIVHDEDWVPLVPASPESAEEAARLDRDTPAQIALRAAQLRQAHYAHAGAPVSVSRPGQPLAFDRAWTDAHDRSRYLEILQATTAADGTVDPERRRDELARRFASHSLEAYLCALDGR